ncbi:Txe/YoeB family addiction module toxin [Agromyces laixinhei]|uniref:Txe/YoeB family addiction module toxin n=1 Tax=Agromyces laixinhei TaxID=2585717 RepID=UPI0022B72067|nr:Txe/YoeB family addiction module toxin [Agromyces laixinhei]
MQRIELPNPCRFDTRSPARPLGECVRADERERARVAEGRSSNDNEGIGKPEPLKHGFHGLWSRRITDEHRLIYKVEHDEIRIAGCRCRYGR